MLVNVGPRLFRRIYRSNEISITHYPFDVLRKKARIIGAVGVVIIHQTDFYVNASNQLRVTGLGVGWIYEELVFLRY